MKFSDPFPVVNRKIRDCIVKEVALDILSAEDNDLPLDRSRLMVKLSLQWYRQLALVI